MLRIGITGGIGSGKSYICKAFEHLGIPVFYADDEVKKMYDDTPEVHAQLIAAFGENIYSNENLNKKQLAQKVFSDSSALQTLNAIAHPAVEKRFTAWCARQKNAPYVIQEAALMFESNAHRQMDKVITVTSPVEVRLERVTGRDGCTREEVRQRMAHQLSDEERNPRADFVIVNDNVAPLLPQIIKIHEALLTL
jgi:dephospho-CoA kinase